MNKIVDQILILVDKKLPYEQLRKGIEDIIINNKEEIHRETERRLNREVDDDTLWKPDFRDYEGD